MITRLLLMFPKVSNKLFGRSGSRLGSSSLGVIVSENVSPSGGVWLLVGVRVYVCVCVGVDWFNPFYFLLSIALPC